MISLVLATYNGEKYIIDQLESIINQSLQPDEVIIRDDCSTDATQSIIFDFIERNKLKWKFVPGEKNLGWRGNFYYAIKEAAGDIIFLCDQDDIWHPEKIESMVSVIESHPEIMLLASGYHSIYFDNVKKINLPGDPRNDGSIEKVPFDKHCLSITYPGCTYCFRKSLKDEYIKHGSPQMAHDAQLWCLAVGQDGLYIFNKVLMDQVRHPEAATIKSASFNKEFMIFSTESRIKMLDIIKKQSCNNSYAEERIKFIGIMKRWLEARLEMYISGNIFCVFKVLPYLSCYEKPKHFIRDIILCLK